MVHPLSCFPRDDRQATTIFRLAFAGFVVCLLFGQTGRAQGPGVSRGTVAGRTNGETLKVATWNLEWFYDANPRDNESELAKIHSAPNAAAFEFRLSQFAVAIAALQPDILALQEVENQLVLDQLAERLKKSHGQNYHVVFVQGRDSATEQDVGLLVSARFEKPKGERIETIEPQRYRNRDRYQVPSKHLVARIDTHRQQGVGPLLVVTTHLKAGRNPSDEQQRIFQSRVLNEFATLEQSKGWQLMILGDLNSNDTFLETRVDGAVGVLTGRDSPGDDDDFLDLHHWLPAQGRRTHVSGRELDRMAVSPRLTKGPTLQLQGVLVSVPSIQPWLTSPTAKDTENRLSDHYPVMATFHIQRPPRQ